MKLPASSICLFVSVLVCLTTTSCTSFDIEHSRLVGTVETNPKPNAITGMWHGAATDGWGLQIRSSFLFNKDGTGLESYHHRDWLIGTQDRTNPFTWSYAGGGVWKIQFTELKYAKPSEGRLSQGKLLLPVPHLGHAVLERVKKE